MLLRARHVKEWDERHVAHGMLQALVAQSVERDKARSVALAIEGKNALCILMQVASKQLDIGPKTLQGVVDAQWQLPFTTCGGVECICCAWATMTGILGVPCPPKVSSGLVHGAYAIGMSMKTTSQTTWRREVSESHLGSSRGTTSARKNVHRTGHHHGLAEESFCQHFTQRYGMLCPTLARFEVVGRNIVFITGEAMGIGVSVTNAEAAIVSRTVEVYIGYVVKGVGHRTFVTLSGIASCIAAMAFSTIYYISNAAKHGAPVLKSRSNAEECLTAPIGNGIVSMSMPPYSFSLALAMEGCVK